MATKKKYKILLIVFAAMLILLPAAYFFLKWQRHRQNLADDKSIDFKYKINVHDPTLKGYLLLTPFQPFVGSNGSIIIMDMDGVIYYQANVHNPSYDLKQWHINGKIFYSYIINDPKACRARGVKINTGHVVILDSAMNEIRQVHLLPHDDIIINRKQDLDLHEFIMLSETHFVTVAAYEKTVNNIPSSLHPAPGVKVLAPIIQETSNDSVIWQWDGSRFPELYEASVENNHFGDTTRTQDYLHFNALLLDPRDSNFICSFRCADQLIKVNRKTGNIAWKLGGVNSDFPMNNEQKFLKQHDPTLTDSNQALLLFDNGDNNTRKSSRIMEFRLDEVHKKIISFTSFPIPGPPCYFMGKVDKEGDDYFISTGTGNSVLEVNRKTRKTRFEMAINQLSYRVYKVDSIYGLEKRR